MRGTSAGQFIRGGQTTQHWARMFVQVLRYATTVALTAFVLVAGGLLFKDFDLTTFTLSRQWVMANFNVMRGMSDFQISVIQPDGSRAIYASIDVQRSPLYRAAYDELEALARFAMNIGIYAAAIGGALVFVIFFVAGKRLGRYKHVRGALLVTGQDIALFSKERWKEARRIDKRYRGQPRFKVAGIEAPPNAMQAQTLICGTTGVGKTTLIKELLVSIREAGGCAIIYDRTGDYAASFYDEERDVIINPFDERSHCWSPFHDADSAESFSKLYDVLIPNRPEEKDKFWPQAARIVAEFVSRELLKRGLGTNAALREAIMTLPIETVEELVRGTPADKFIGEAAGKMGTSVYATMLAELRFMEFLRDDGPKFSARDWVHQVVEGDVVDVDADTGEILSDTKAGGHGEGGSFLFLTGHPEFDTTTRNITSAIMEIAATTLMAGNKSFEPKLFFIIDELPTLNRLPFLVGKLAEVRNVGGCFVLGIQVLSQLESVYGKADARTIIGNLNNTVILSTPDKETALVLSDGLGKVDQIETQENLSFGATEVRDGASMNTTRAERAIITPTEIMKLPQFAGYLTFAYDCPTALVTFKRQKDKVVADAISPYTGAGFGHDELDPEVYRARNQFLSLSQATQAGEFLAWLEDYKARQTCIDEQFELTDDDKRALWMHYASERMSGFASDVIGPPMLSSGSDQKVFLHPRDQKSYLRPIDDQMVKLEQAPRLLVAGSLDFEDRDLIWNALDAARLNVVDAILCHKGAVGADTIAADWARARRVPQHVFEPKWDIYGSDAPDYAHREMLDGPCAKVLIFGADEVVSHLMKGARDLNIPLHTESKVRGASGIPPYPIPDNSKQNTSADGPSNAPWHNGAAPSGSPSPTASGGAGPYVDEQPYQPDLFSESGEEFGNPIASEGRTREVPDDARQRNPAPESRPRTSKEELRSRLSDQSRPNLRPDQTGQKARRFGAST